jgi:hypothetical protein
MSFGIITDSTELSTERPRSGLPARSSVIGRRQAATSRQQPASGREDNQLDPLLQAVPSRARFAGGNMYKPSSFGIGADPRTP